MKNITNVDNTDDYREGLKILFNSSSIITKFQNDLIAQGNTNTHLNSSSLTICLVALSTMIQQTMLI